MFFHSWADLYRVALVGAPAYLALVLLLRISGKRTLSKLNAFDLVVTVAMGSTLATILLSSDVSLTEGVTALALLVVLQFVITWTSIRWGRMDSLVKSDPTLLFYEERFLERAMARERITEAEILSAARSEGFANLGSVQAVVLETDGSLSVISATDAAPAVLDGVRGAP